MRAITILIGVALLITAQQAEQKFGLIELPMPQIKGNVSLEESIALRRSVRDFADEPLSLKELSQLLWAGQGMTDQSRGLRAAPSAGALYPLELIVVAKNVEGLKPGAYRYVPQKHALRLIKSGELSPALARAGLGQHSISEAPAVILINGIYARTTIKYGERGTRYVHIEVGCSLENMLLQAVALNLGAVVVGAFDDDEIKQVTGSGKSEQPLALICVGRTKK